MSSFFQMIRNFIRRLLGLREDLVTDHIRPNDRLHLDAKASNLPVWLNRARKSPVVATPPAAKALEFFQFVMPRKAFERVFAQAFADFRQEYFDDLAAGRNVRARCQHAWFYVTLASTTILWFVTSIGKKAYELWRYSG